MALTDWTWSCSDWVLLLIFIGVVLYFLGTSGYSHFSKQNIPFVKPLPFVGSMGPALRRKEYLPQLVIRIYRELKDHPYGGLFVFKQPIVMLRDPELIKAITVKDFEYFMDHLSVFSEDAEPVWSRGLMNLKGNDIHVCIFDICAIYVYIPFCIKKQNGPSCSSQLQRVRGNSDGGST
jgi:hypothetical protein